MHKLPFVLALPSRKNTVNWTATIAGPMLTSLPMLNAFAVPQRRRAQGLTGGAVKDT